MPTPPDRPALDRRELLGAMSLAAAAGLAFAADAAPAPASKIAAPGSRSPACAASPRPQGLPQDRDQPQNHRLGRSDRPEPHVAACAGRIAVRVARRRKPDAHRAPLAEALPLAPRHARRRRSWSTPSPAIDMALWDITGKLLGRAGLPSARRPAARQDPHVSHRQGDQARHRRPASVLRQPARHQRPGQNDRGQPQEAWARTAPSCSTPTAPCRRPC